jgi:hypothetical protein
MWQADAAGDKADRWQYDRLMCQYDRVDMACTWANQWLTRGIHRLVVKVPRGPVKGCHVAPRDWFMVMCKILWTGFEPWTYPPSSELVKSVGPIGHMVLLINQTA